LFDEKVYNAVNVPDFIDYLANRLLNLRLLCLFLSYDVVLFKKNAAG